MNDGIVVIEYSAIENGRKDFNGNPIGYLPYYWNNDQGHGNTWSPNGWDRAIALEIAKVMAEEEAARYIGDWTVTTKERL
jgi:hypothetical protein